MLLNDDFKVIQMKKKLTSDYKFIAQFNALAAEVYRDKKEFFLSFRDIAEYRVVSELFVRDKFKEAKQLLKNRNQAWMNGLSRRAKMALITCNKYNDFKSLCEDVMKEKIDLEDYPKIGHQVATEIRRWCVSH